MDERTKNSRRVRFEKIPIWSIDNNESVPIHHASFSKNNSEVALSQWDGTIQIYSSRTGRLSYAVDFLHKDTIVTCTKFHPIISGIFLATSSSGYLGLFELPSGSCSWSLFEEENNIQCCDFSPDGNTFVTVGSDAIVRVYDTSKHQLIHAFGPSEAIHHNQRLFSCVFDPSSPSLFVTGGWDTTPILWDLRSARPVRTFGGPNIAGDSLDIKNGLLLTGAWRQKTPLELWELGTGRVIRRGEWGNDICQVYSAKFCKDQDFIVAGGSDFQSLKIFGLDLNPMERLGFFEKAVNSIAVSKDGKILVGASQNGRCQAFAETNTSIATPD